ADLPLPQEVAAWTHRRTARAAGASWLAWPSLGHLRRARFVALAHEAVNRGGVRPRCTAHASCIHLDRCTDRLPARMPDSHVAGVESGIAQRDRRAAPDMKAVGA